jgi:choline dehydrogenase-like flavoprotein
MSEELNISCDVVVVGGGISGAWAAKELCEAGLEVLLLEAGNEGDPGAQEAAGRSTGEERAPIALRQPIQSRHPAYSMHNPEHFVDDIDNPYVSEGPEPFLWIRGRQLGGRSLTWGGITLRFSDYEFHAADAEGTTPQWPLSHEELAPFYSKVESFLGVEGARDGLPQIPDGVFETPAPLSAAEMRFRQAVESRWRDRRVVQCRGVPANSSTRAGDDRRWSARAVQYRVLPAASRTGRLKIRSNCVVSRLLVSETADRIVGVSCTDRLTGHQFAVRGHVVALCASTIESVRILLNSRTDRMPQGLANSSGCVGRYLLDHAATVLVGRIPGEPLHEPVPSAQVHGILIPRFRNCGRQTARFSGGYGIWGSMGRTRWPDTGECMWSLCAMMEVLPRPENRVHLDETRVDAWGVPVPRIDFRYSANEDRMREDAESSMREMVGGVAWRIEQEVRLQPGQFVHELGGARMGKSPKSSVVNAMGQSWDVRNLFVLDGASFVTAGWQNPTLTIMALAARACRYIAAGIRHNGI